MTRKKETFTQAGDSGQIKETVARADELAQNGEMIVREQAKPKRGRGGTQNFPNAKFKPETDEDKAYVSKLLGEAMFAYKQPKVQSDEELAERLNQYFEHCAKNAIIPTVEEMCLFTGWSYAACYDWETGRRQGFSPETAKIIKRAKEFMKTFDAKLVTEGKQNPIVYFFRAKNYYGMVDKQEYVVTPNVNNDSDYDAEAIRQRYISDSANDSPQLPG